MYRTTCGMYLKDFTPVSKQHKFVNNVIDMFNYGRNYLASSSKRWKRLRINSICNIRWGAFYSNEKVMEWKKNIGENRFYGYGMVANHLEYISKIWYLWLYHAWRGSGCNLAQNWNVFKMQETGNKSYSSRWWKSVNIWILWLYQRIHSASWRIFQIHRHAIINILQMPKTGSRTGKGVFRQ